jgi:transcription antitermination factor NusG
LEPKFVAEGPASNRLSVYWRSDQLGFILDYPRGPWDETPRMGADRPGLKGRKMPKIMKTSLSWFAIRVRSRCEKLAAQDLAARGFEVCSACAPQRRVWADRVRTVEMPMFPGYIFAQFELVRVGEVLENPAIASIVKFGGRYWPVDDSEIEAVRAVVASGVEVSPVAGLRPGMRVRICHGSLQGVEGLLDEVKNQRRLVVSISLLQRSIAVELADVMVEPVYEARRTSTAA